jgi:hypothetical protein
MTMRMKLISRLLLRNQQSLPFKERDKKVKVGHTLVKQTDRPQKAGSDGSARVNAASGRRKYWTLDWLREG